MNRAQCVPSAGMLPRGLRVSSVGILPRGFRQLRRLAVALAILSLPAFSSVGWAIDIGAGLNGPFGFDTAPTTADFTTMSIGGAGNGILDAAALNAAVQALNASSIVTALPTDTANPPGNNGLARWNSALQAVQTAATGNNATILMGKFINTSDNFVTGFAMVYDSANYVPTATELLGHAVYYSTTGAANSWQSLGQWGDPAGQVFFSADDFAAAGQPLWGNDPLYLLWADDNGDGSTDTKYTIDNMIMEVILGDPKEPPPPPTPEFGNITPPQSQDFETPGSGFAINNGAQGALVPLVGTQALQINSAALGANPDQVDLRGLAAGLQKVVSMDLKAWETSAGSDFEAVDHITITADVSTDGLAFTTITLLDLHGAPILDPFDPTIPNPADQLRATFGPTESLNNADQPFVHFDFVLPNDAQTVRLHIDMSNDSTSEFMAIDNIAVRGVPVPEPGSIALLGFGVAGLFGYAVRRRKAA